LKVFNLLDKLQTWFEKFVISFSVIMMSIILIGNVISRSVFNRSWTFAEETGQILVVAITFVGLSYAARQSRHISMSAVFDLLSDKYKKIFMLIISSVTALAMFYLGYLAFHYTLSVYELGRVTPALRLPMYLVTAFIPLGFILGGFQYLKTFVINLKEKEIYLSYERTIHDKLDEAYEGSENEDDSKPSSLLSKENSYKSTNIQTKLKAK
jgi:C4-dicarboxylate transporter, DctQ subunit